MVKSVSSGTRQTSSLIVFRLCHLPSLLRHKKCPSSVSPSEELLQTSNASNASLETEGEAWHVVSAQLLRSVQLICNSMDCSLPGSSVHGFLQARILDWVAISFSRVISFSVIHKRNIFLYTMKFVCYNMFLSKE